MEFHGIFSRALSDIQTSWSSFKWDPEHLFRQPLKLDFNFYDSAEVK